jgi:hypothetical protein
MKLIGTAFVALATLLAAAPADACEWGDRPAKIIVYLRKDRILAGMENRELELTLGSGAYRPLQRWIRERQREHPERVQFVLVADDGVAFGAIARTIALARSEGLRYTYISASDSRLGRKVLERKMDPAPCNYEPW